MLFQVDTLQRIIIMSAIQENIAGHVTQQEEVSCTPRRTDSRVNQMLEPPKALDTPCCYLQRFKGNIGHNACMCGESQQRRKIFFQWKF